MVAMAEEYGADPRLVAFMQYLRVVVVVLSASVVARLILGHPAPTVLQAEVPLLPPFGPLLATLAVAGVGAVAGRFLRIPAGALLLPMLLGAGLQASGLLAITLPPWLLAAAYATLGWYVGLGFDREVTLHALRAIPRLLLATAALIGLCALSAWLLTWLLGIDGLTAFLATSPGGLDSVAIIAVGSHADVPFVLAIQTLRLFLIILIGPALARLIARAAPEPGAQAPR
jgi:membrane AbrB-like protein